MRNWLTHHKLSEALATQAHEQLRIGHRAKAEELFRQAAQKEQEAMVLLGPDKPRTLGIMAVSSVSLMYKGREIERALHLAYRCLADPVITGSSREQLEDLVQTLYTEREKERLSGQFLPGAVTVAVRGGDVLRGAAPLELIVEKVKTLQAIFFRLVEWQSGKPLRRRGGPTKDITRAYEPWLVQEAPGSFQFSVAMKVNGQLDMFSAENMEATDVAQKFLAVVTTMATDPTGEASKQLVPDSDYRNAFRKLIRNLTPPASSNESITISSKEQPEGLVVLNRETRPTLDLTIKADSPQADASAGESVQEFVGVLRALDLDDDWLKVDVDGKEVKVIGLAQALDDVIGPMVNKSVSVKTIKPKRGSLKFVDISLVE